MRYPRRVELWGSRSPMNQHPECGESDGRGTESPRLSRLLPSPNVPSHSFPSLPVSYDAPIFPANPTFN